jgi:hypothetical protein
MHSGGEMILGNRHHHPRYKMTFVIRLLAVHPMELRIRIRAPLLQPHAQFMGEAGVSSAPRHDPEFRFRHGEW